MAMYGYGGNFLNNDGHVVWKRSEDCSLHYDSTVSGETWLAHP
jgi:hypothetical protein